MDEIVSNSTADRRFQALLLGAFAVLALVLAAVGIYGVMAYGVAQRTHELAIRIALGAQHIDVFRLIVGQGMRLAVAGVAIGLAGAFALTRFLRTLLFEIEPTDPITFGGVSILLALVALLACYVPARHASRVDPIAGLRHQ
jgi:putative ABC transport system permease protein